MDPKSDAMVFASTAPPGASFVSHADAMAADEKAALPPPPALRTSRRRARDDDSSSGSSSSSADGVPIPPFFEHLTEWFAECDDETRMKENPYNNYLYCTKHHVWCEAYPVLTGGGNPNGPKRDCDRCPVGRSLYEVAAEALREVGAQSMATVQQARTAWADANKRFGELKVKLAEAQQSKAGGSGAADKLQAEVRAALQRTTFAWLVYENLVWCTCRAIRATLLLHPDTDTLSPDDRGALLDYNADARERYGKPLEGMRNPMMKCIRHGKIGDAVPWRPAKRYNPECFVCIVPLMRSSLSSFSASSAMTAVRDPSRETL